MLKHDPYCKWCSEEFRPEVNEPQDCVRCGVPGCGYCLPRGLCEECRAETGQPEPFDDARPSVKAAKANED